MLVWLSGSGAYKTCIVSAIYGDTKVIAMVPKKKLWHQRKNWDTKEKKIKMY